MSDVKWVSLLKLKASYGEQGNDNLASVTYYWHPYADGATIGQQGTQGGIIVSDEACKGARITLEKGGAVPYAMLCAMDGTAFHTVLASDEQDAMMR